MKITFTGTGTSQGVPVIACNCEVCKSVNPKDKRLRTSAIIETDHHVFVIDAGPDFRQQMLREQVTCLDAILLTHGHKDHIGGLDDIRAFNYFLQRPMDVYGHINVLASLKCDFAYAFEEDKYPGAPEINFIAVENKPFFIQEVEIIPIKVMHYHLEIFGYRIKDLTYITDANMIPEEELEKIKGSRVLVINGLRQKKHLTHFSLKEALDIIKIVEPERAYITHISHQMGLYDDISKKLPENVMLAYDGLVVEL